VPLLADLTLIIPTYRRPKLLAMLLQLLASQPIRLRTLIADGSVDEIQEQNRISARQYPEAVIHLSFPSTLAIELRLMEALKQVETEYCVVCADDDIILPEGVAQSVEFLRSHPDFVACHGPYYGVSRDPQELHINVEYAVAPIDLSSPFARMLEICARYQSPFYSVQRTAAMVNAFVSPDDVAPTHFWELFNALSVVFQGKVMALNVPYYLRNQQLGDRPEFIGDPNNFIVADAKRYLQEFSGFRNYATRFFRSLSTEDVDWERRIDIAYFLYLSRSIAPARFIWLMEETGMISQGDASTLKERTNLPNAAEIPGEYLMSVLRPMVALGWPTYDS